MAKFLKVHHEDVYCGIEEYLVNLEMIVIVDEKSHEIGMANGATIHVARDNEWQKLMSFVKTNEV